MAKLEMVLTTKVANGSPYRLDPEQVERAATALVSHMKKHKKQKEQAASKKNLLVDGDASEDDSKQDDSPIYLTLATKKHIQDQNRLKPNKITLVHPIINSKDIQICLITADPQRAYKNLVADPAFPEKLQAKIGRVIGLQKLKAKYKTYESRRQLLAEYDIFLADSRIIKSLPQALGKIFYSGAGKRPIPVNLAAGTKKQKDDSSKKKDANDKTVGTPQAVAREIEIALKSTLVNLSASANTTIKVGRDSMKPRQIMENVGAVVSVLTNKFVPQGWRGIRGLHIKGPNSMALPIWLADELWADEEQVLDEKWKVAVKDGKSNITEKKRKWEAWEDELMDEDEIAERRANMKKLKKSKSKSVGNSTSNEEGAISKERRKKLKDSALKSVQAPLIDSE
ncbi:ribosomal protein L1 [Zopfia rhizophila CBS 207.26]|uniref:Ribosomal protein L1 n=1 Tax=Zopfia rhizophila CBS 207.26 TaxID=1314779 RepID=A0A6A6EM76_9PEZI|nr:ribosomal protein L1 [Zopfia rhizophila CBS 207.26]